MGTLKAHMDMTWDIARRLVKLSDKQREEIFGYSDVSRVIKYYSANITNKRINEYERKVKEETVNIGDIVYYEKSQYNGIVTDIKYQVGDKVYCDLYVVIFADGSVIETPRNQLTKTGETVDILPILKELLSH